MNFSNWLPIETEPDYHGPAVYEFRISVDARPVPLGRAFGTDPNGTILYGCTKRFSSRWWQSYRAWQTCSGSSTLNLLYFIERFTPLRTLYPSAVFEYRYAIAESVEQAKQWEERLLKRYFRQYGDRPLLNSAIPNRYGSYEEPADES